MLVVPSLAQAQRQQVPTRPYRGLFGGGPPADPNRTRTELSLNASLSGGYDQDVLTTSTQPGDGSVATTGDLGLDYYFGRAARSFSTEGRTFVTSYANTGTDPLIGGDIAMRGELELGRRSRLTLSQSFSYAPNLVLGTFGLLDQAVDPGDLPDTGDISGLVDQRSWTSDTGVSLDRRFTSRQTLSGAYTYGQRTYLDEAGYDVATHALNASYAWSITSTTGIRASYDLSRSSYSDPTRTGATASAPMTDHGLLFGADYTRRLSRTRQIQFSGSVGASYVDTFNSTSLAAVSYWTPSATGTVRMDLGQTWALSGDYRRGTNVLQGVSLDTFSTNAFSVRADGAMGRRIRAAVSTAFSTGRSGIDAESTFRALGSTAQFNYAFARCCAASVNYDFYSYRMNQVTLPGELPSNYDRNSIRAGFSFWLPLLGNYSAGEGGPQPPRPAR